MPESKRGAPRKYNGDAKARRKQSLKNHRMTSDAKNITVNGEVLELVKNVQGTVSARIGVPMSIKQSLTIALREWLENA